jgi:Transcriptional regulator
MDKKKFDYNLIRYLVVIVETGSMVSAAEVLNVAPSAISYAVKKLRAHYHDPLFTRRLNGIIPTALAMNLYGKFKAIDSDIIGALNVENVLHKFTRKIYIRCDPFIELWLTEQLLQRQLIPNDFGIEFRYFNLDNELRASKLRNKEVDIDIGLPLPGDRNLVARPLFDLDFTLICRDSHKSIGEFISREQLANEKYVAYGLSTYSTLLRTDTFDAIESRNVDPVIVSDSFLNLILAVTFEDMLIFCPARYVQFLKKIIPVREVKCEYIKKGNVKFVAHVHKQNIGNSAIEK